MKPYNEQKETVQRKFNAMKNEYPNQKYNYISQGPNELRRTYSLNICVAFTLNQKSVFISQAKSIKVKLV